MSSLFRQAYSVPVPEGAEIVKKNGKRYARILIDGKPTLCPLTERGDRYRRRSNRWYGQYVDAAGRTVRVPLSANRAAAQLMLNDLVREVEQEKAGLVTDHTRHRRAPVADLLAEYRAHSHGTKGNSVKQADETARRCEKVFDGCGVVLLADVDAEAAERWLAGQRAKTKAAGGIGPQTFNHYVAALKAFGNWLVSSRKAADNPFRYLRKVNAEVDVRKNRRPLTPDEFNRLIVATAAGRRSAGCPDPIVWNCTSWPDSPGCGRASWPA